MASYKFAIGNKCFNFLKQTIASISNSADANIIISFKNIYVESIAQIVCLKGKLKQILQISRHNKFGINTNNIIELILFKHFVIVSILLSENFK